MVGRTVFSGAVSAPNAAPPNIPSKSDAASNTRLAPNRALLRDLDAVIIVVELLLPDLFRVLMFSARHSRRQAHSLSLSPWPPAAEHCLVGQFLTPQSLAYRALGLPCQ